MDQGRFHDKTVVVTGGNSGIGKATAMRFAREGASVAIVARREDAGAITIKEIEKLGGRASFHKADVAESEEIESAMNEILARYGGIDAAFNNAGSPGGVCTFDAVSVDEFDDVLRTNLYGVLHCMKFQIRHFIERKKAGSIVNCSSVSGLVGAPFQAAYCASKHAVVGLTKTVALEYASQGIRVNAICPGGVATPMLKNYLGQLSADKAKTLSAPPIGRAAAPEEIASIVTWLCSNEASYVIGQAYAVDGGYTVR